MKIDVAALSKTVSGVPTLDIHVITGKRILLCLE